MTMSKGDRDFRGDVDHAQRTLDRWLKGDDAALSEEQKQGLKLFIDKGCSNCHNGVNIGGAMYARFGVVQNPGPELLPPEDLGRFAVTKNVDRNNMCLRSELCRNIELKRSLFS